MNSYKRFVSLIFVKILFKLGIKIPPVPTVSAIISHNNKILMYKLNYKDGYALPGGGLEGFETFEEGLEREIKEELGVNVRTKKYLTATKERKSYYNTAHITYIVELDSDNYKNSAEGSAEWLEFAEAIDKCVYKDEIESIRFYLEQTNLTINNS